MDLRAVIFIPALVGAVICGFFFLIFASHYYLTVLESTAAGAKEVTWLSESLTDNFWKPFYLAWLLCLWLGPAYVLGRTLAASTGINWLGFALPVFVAWGLYPVSQLSSLCASSLWIPLHPQVFARLVQKPGVTIGFFVFTLPVFALGGLGFKWAFLTAGQWDLLFLGTPLMSLAGFLYARFLGRLAFALRFTRDLLKRRKKKRAAKLVRSDEPVHGTEVQPAEEPSEESKPEVVQPSDLPPITTPLDGELAGYNILIAHDPPAPRKRVRAEVAEEPSPVESVPPRPQARTRAKSDHPLDRGRTWTEDDDDTTPYEMQPSEVKDEERVPEEVAKPKAEEMALLDRSDAPKRPKRTWSLELFVFLFQPGTITALVIASGMATMAGVMVRVARQFYPTGGE
jgi:hypothetical protein